MQRQWKNPSDVIKRRKTKLLPTASEHQFQEPPPCKKLKRNTVEGATLSAVPMPLDWSVKKHARFTSATSFSWAGVGGAVEEAAATASFLHDSGTVKPSPSSDFQRRLMVWIYPGLPFLQTIDTSVDRLQLDPNILTAVQEEWNTSFRSVYHMFKGDHCSHFYLCAANFSVLFQRSSETMCAFLCPSTAGLRQALKQNGVQFNSPVNADSPDREDGTSASSWLQSIGFTSDSSPSSKITLQAQRTSSTAKETSETVVEVDGQHMHGLFNFLLNSKSIVFSGGPLAGLPPTLLSPTAFLGAALIMLKAKHGVLNECLGSKMVTKHYLEVAGPILPNALSEMLRILQSTQLGEYSARLAPVPNTTSFNFDPSTTATLRTISSENYTCSWS